MRKNIQLAYPYEEKRLLKWGGKAIIQPKLDGDRCRAIFDENGKVKLVSSEENLIVNVPHIVKQLEELNFRYIELDGEIYKHGEAQSDIHGMRSRTTNLEQNDLEYHVFDYVVHMEQERRLDILRKVIPANLLYVKFVQPEWVFNTEDIEKKLEQYIADGYEGFILRHPSALYSRSRSTYMMKFKPQREDVYLIVETDQERDMYGVPKWSLGALACRGNDNTVFRVGTGFTKDQREKLWEQRASLPGKFAKVKYQHLTAKNGVPRSSVFVEILDTWTSNEFEGQEVPQL